MGNGALSTLAKDQHVEVTLAMKMEYEKLNALNLPEDQLQRLLMEKFHLTIKEQSEKRIREPPTKSDEEVAGPKSVSSRRNSKDNIELTISVPSSRRNSKENNIAPVITPISAKKATGIKAVPSKIKPKDANRRRSFGPEAKGNLAAVAAKLNNGASIIAPVAVNDAPPTENILIESASAPVLCTTVQTVSNNIKC